MSGKLLPLSAVKLTEGGRIRVPLSLSVDQVKLLDAFAGRFDLERATAARVLLVRALEQELRT